MVWYRLTFRNSQIFDLGIDRARDSEQKMASGRIYRVTAGVREAAPLRRETGAPIEIHASSGDAAVAIATDVLTAVTGSRLIAEPQRTQEKINSSRNQ